METSDLTYDTTERLPEIIFQCQGKTAPMTEIAWNIEIIVLIQLLD